MLKVDEKTLDYMEKQHPGIRQTIRFFDEAVLPGCSRCGSANTATVGCGVIGRTIYLAGATTKFKLIPNPPKPGEYFCNDCNEFFG
jgi:hypothetical protein